MFSRVRQWFSGKSDASLPIVSKGQTLALLVTLAVLSLGAFFYNIVNYPYLDPDEGIYLLNAMAFARYANPFGGLPPDLLVLFKYVHPPLGWMILGSYFRLTDYISLVDRAAAGSSSSWAVLFVPRAFMSSLAALDVFLVFLIGNSMYNNRLFGFLAAGIFAVTEPSVTFFRWILLDPIMTTFVLASTLALLNKRSYVRHSSGILLGAAILAKLPAAFFVLPFAAMMFKQSRGNRLVSVLAWLGLVALVSGLFPLYALGRGQFSQLLSGQLWHSSEVGLPLSSLAGVLRYYVTDFRFFLLGFAGLAYLSVRRDYFIPSLCLSFFGFFAVLPLPFLTYYVIPLIPFLAIAGAKLLLDASSLVPRRLWQALRLNDGRVIALVLVVLLCLGSIPALRDVTANDSGAQLQAADYLIRNAPPGSVVIANPAYSWILGAKQGVESHLTWELAVWNVSEVPPGKPTYLVTDSIVSRFTAGWPSDNPVVVNLREMYNSSRPLARFNSSWVQTEVLLVCDTSSCIPG